MTATISNFFRELQLAEASNIIILAALHFHDFTFQGDLEFRHSEEDLSLVQRMSIPPEAWERFWNVVDERKVEALAQIERDGFDAVFDHVFQQIERGWGSLEPMSPFNWSKAIVVGVGAVLGIVNTTGAVPSSGISLASVVVSVITSGYGAG